MKYVILIYSNPASREIWNSFTEAEKSAGFEAYGKLKRSLAESGELIVTEALAEAAQSKRVAVHDGRAIATDGPFAEAKEHLAGFFLVECENMDRAVDIAARIPEAPLGLVEVRPVLDLGEMVS